MWEILEGVGKVILLFGNPVVLETTFRSIVVSGTATLLSALLGIPLGVLIGFKDFAGKRFVKTIFNALLGVPTVALGLILYLAFSHSGFLGFLDLLYTPVGIMIGQAILIVPIMISLVIHAVESVDPDVMDLARTLGASETEASFAVLRESTAGVTLAFISCFNRAIAELGVAVSVGGNIRGWTRMLTTTIALEARTGEIEYSIAMAAILLLIVFAVTLVINLIQGRRL
ncbi:MAG: ABC transporter permease [Candidatus Bathyarchaeota archaeon]|nr:MAG: ABC transporter permease [Candidatus Bathyarchaeota archaeon]